MVEEILFSIKIILKIILVNLLFLSQISAAETLDYVTEHLLESQMNGRFQCLPDIEFSSQENNIRIKLAYSRFTGGPSTSNVILAGIQKNISIAESRSMILSLFYDQAFIKTNHTSVIANIIKNQPVISLQSSSIILDEKNSSAYHFGVGLGETFYLQPKFAIETGINGSIYQTKNLILKFTTQSELENYSGSIDYNHKYIMFTPHIILNWFSIFRPLEMNSVARLIIAYPLPRKDLARVVNVGNNQINLETSAQHIPDGFVGLGYALESQSKKWRVDIGTTLDFIFLEGNLRHKGITNPFLLSYSFIY